MDARGLPALPFGDSDELRPGQIVLVETEGEGAEAVFTFVGEQKATLPDTPPVETATTQE